MTAWLLTVALAAEPAPPPNPSSLAFGQNRMVGLGGGWTSGAGLADRAPAEYAAPRVFFTYRGDNLPYRTELGSQYGTSWDVRVGWARPLQPEAGGLQAVGFSARFAAAPTVRFATFAFPFPGAISVHAGGELGMLGGEWWARTPVRLSLLGGMRAALRLAPDMRVELDYTGVPTALEPAFGRDRDTPPIARIVHAEQRGRLTVGFGRLGIGAEGTLAIDQLGGERARSVTLGAVVEGRSYWTRPPSP